jgi:hypothetical protein
MNGWLEDMAHTILQKITNQTIKTTSQKESLLESRLGGLIVLQRKGVILPEPLN